VLDEADEMLSCGFKDQVYDVFSRLPDSTQIMLNTTTMSADVLELTQRFMRDPIHIVVKREEPLLEGIHQFYVAVEKDEWKFDTINKLYETLMITQVCASLCLLALLHARSVHYLLQHPPKGRLAHRTHEKEGIHGVAPPRRHGQG
jgi:superfamily II DNA/RNA helicase